MTLGKRGRPKKGEENSGSARPSSTWPSSRSPCYPLSASRIAESSGFVKADQSSNPKVFAAGDIRRGQSLVVWAIPEGRQAVDLLKFDQII